MTTNADRPIIKTLYLDDISPLLIAWQRTRVAIGSVETALPKQMSSAMDELIAARAEMERSVNALLPLLFAG